ncbi:phage protein, beta [Oceanobacillus picturae]|uniref:Phage protein, beta n=1 Tax=Oceanobacillus picturae TaxID=171693 RepID=A0A0U9HE59_9BACI|nr:hypothetical protein [Oceanobacillus picturae]GAQ19553.1 phage protein, beta [Oceanobacillus picturae]
MYYATLNQKQGELRALKKLLEFGTNVNQFVPNLIINDSTQENLDTIRKSYSEYILLDVRNLDSNEIDNLEELLEQPNNEEFDIVYPIEYLLENSIQEKKKYVRISRSVVNPFFIQWLQTNIENLPMTVILDFEYIDSVSDDIISRFIPIVELLNDREIVIMSGAVPQSVPVSSEEDYQFNRIEKDLFKKIKELAPHHSKLQFGDYSSVSPILATGGRAIVQIKYTLDKTYWFVRNGLRRGNYDFVAVCQQITNSNSFDESFCWGDEYIKSVVDENTNKGNPSVWTSIGVNRHTAVCLSEL